MSGPHGPDFVAYLPPAGPKLGQTATALLSECTAAAPDLRGRLRVLKTLSDTRGVTAADATAVRSALLAQEEGRL